MFNDFDKAMSSFDSASDAIVADVMRGLEEMIDDKISPARGAFFMKALEVKVINLCTRLLIPVCGSIAIATNNKPKRIIDFELKEIEKLVLTRLENIKS